MRIFPFLLLLAVFSACSRPVSEEYFILKGDAPEGVYAFPLDLADTTVAYDLSLFVRPDPRDSSGFPLTASWYKGDSLRFTEELFFPDRPRSCSDQQTKNTQGFPCVFFVLLLSISSR